MKRLLPVLMGFIALLGIQQAQAKAPFDECDRLTKHPFDKRGLGDGVDFSKLDADRAIKACENAVNSYPNEPRFQFQLGRAFDKKKQYETAIRWYKKVAKDYSYPSAQNNLGHMYRGGKGVTQNYKTALKWSTLAAEQGNANAQTLLGFVYSLGEGVIKDYVRAHMWFNIAASSGESKKASKNRDIVAKRMNTSQIEIAQKLARECVKKNYKGC